MITYLYIKTHTKTGLKYLGITKRSNPHKYLGSGKYWRRHLNAHGKTYTTEIIKECYSESEVKQWGRYYSDLWNIVDSSEWANLKPEDGIGGSYGPMTPESLSKQMETKRRNGTLSSTTPESVAKQLATKSLNPYKHSPETISKMRDIFSNRLPLPKISCLHCKKVMNIGNFGRHKKRNSL